MVQGAHPLLTTELIQVTRIAFFPLFKPILSFITRHRKDQDCIVPTTHNLPSSFPMRYPLKVSGEGHHGGHHLGKREESVKVRAMKLGRAHLSHRSDEICYPSLYSSPQKIGSRAIESRQIITRGISTHNPYFAKLISSFKTII